MPHRRAELGTLMRRQEFVTEDWQPFRSKRKRDAARGGGARLRSSTQQAQRGESLVKSTEQPERHLVSTAITKEGRKQNWVRRREFRDEALCLKHKLNQPDNRWLTEIYLTSLPLWYIPLIYKVNNWQVINCGLWTAMFCLWSLLRPNWALF